ncbi:MAG: NADH dehydrogenase subunit [bacterium]
MGSDNFPRPGEETISERLQKCGVTGAGGAGFPTYVKWQNLEKIKSLLVNLQEGEPVFYGDKWLVKNNIDLYRRGLNYFLNNCFERIIIGSKEKYRKKWFEELEKELEARIILPDDLPVGDNSGDDILLAYTAERYELSQETALLWTTAGVRIGQDLPTEHGWIVQNAETFYNICRAVFYNKPVLKKQVAIYGPEIKHSFFEVPAGTRVIDLLAEMGVNYPPPASRPVLLDGGPGWCSKIDCEPARAVVSKRTNGIMLADQKFVEKYRDCDPPERINALKGKKWTSDKHQTSPQPFTPEIVAIPLISNPYLSGLVKKSVPVVKKGEKLKAGDIVAEPAQKGISNFQHASISGRVNSVTADQIFIEKN